MPRTYQIRTYRWIKTTQTWELRGVERHWHSLGDLAWLNHWNNTGEFLWLSEGWGDASVPKSSRNSNRKASSTMDSA